MTLREEVQRKSQELQTFGDTAESNLDYQSPNFLRLAQRVDFRSVWPIVWPIIIGSAVQTLLSITDTAFVGRLGQVALGGTALGGLIYLVIIMFAFGFGVGTQVLVARRFGQGRLRQVGRVVTHAFLFQWAMGIALFLLTWSTKDALLGWMISSPNVFAAADTYLSYRLFGLIFAHTNFTFRSFYVGMARTNVITLTSVMMVVVNILLDYLLIFGIGPFPAMGIAGAALASMISEVVCVCTFIVYTMVKIDHRRYRLFSFRVLSWPLLRHLVRLAFPVMLQNVISTNVWLLFFIIIEHMGEQALAISQIVRSVFLMILIPVMGFTSAANTIVSFLLGRHQPSRVIPAVVKIGWYCLAFVAPISLLCTLFAPYMLAVYTDEQPLIAGALPVLYVVAFSSLFQAVGSVYFSGVTGTGRTMTAFLLELAILVLYLLTAYLLAHVFFMPLPVVWTVDILYNVLLIVATLLFFRLANWRGSSV